MQSLAERVAIASPSLPAQTFTDFTHSPHTIKMPLLNWEGGDPPPQPSIHPSDHATYMRLALDQAHESPPKPSNFRVGALLVDADTGAILSRGYTLELPGNTHAEQCCLIKY